MNNDWYNWKASSNGFATILLKITFDSMDLQQIYNNNTVKIINSVFVFLNHWTTVDAIKFKFQLINFVFIVTFLHCFKQIYFIFNFCSQYQICCRMQYNSIVYWWIIYRCVSPNKMTFKYLSQMCFNFREPKKLVGNYSSYSQRVWNFICTFFEISYIFTKL